MGATTAPLSVAAPAAIRNILFATDFSPCSEVALPFAIALAKEHGASLFLTHILPAEPRYELPLEPQRDELNAAKQDAVHRFLAVIDSKELSEVVHAPILRSGRFWQTMQEVIVERQIDFIVTGTRGRGGLSKLFLGSTAELIFRNARCPVMTIGPHVRQEILRGEAGAVVFATDFSAASMQAFPYAVGMARQRGAPLILVHAVVPPVAAIETVVLPTISDELAQDARLRLTEIMRDYPDIPAEIIVSSRPSAEAIVEAATGRNAAAIVLGVQHKGAMATHVPWSVADAVVGRAPCPVLTVRGD
ncbi:MAG: universal stress protein [Terriglobales bacterium]